MSLPRRVFVLLLGAFLALGMSLPVVQAANMPPNTTMTSGMGASGHCPDCGGKGGVAKEMGGCSFGCAAPMLAVIPQAASTRLVSVSAPTPQRYLLLLGRACSPDPDPPRSPDIG
jgi:hypothetical protein